MTAGASSPPWRSSVAVSAFVDSASPGRNEVDSLFSASANFVGSCAGPAAMKMATSQTTKTTHFARGPVAMAKMERGRESIVELCRARAPARVTTQLQDRQVPVELPLRHLHA